MASCLFLMKQFSEVLVYLSSIKVPSPHFTSSHLTSPHITSPRLTSPYLTRTQTYFYNDDTFNFNYGQTLAMSQQWKEAEEAFLLIQSDVFKSEFTYLSWLARACMCLTCARY